MQSFVIADAESTADKPTRKLHKLLTRTVILTLAVAVVLLLALVISTSLILRSCARQTSPVSPDKVDGVNSAQVEALPIKVCLTEECQTAAISFLLTMDQGVDPCDDFYRFSCGNWMPEKEATDQIRVLRRKISEELVDFTESVDDDDIKPLQQMKFLYLSCLNLKSGDVETSPLSSSLPDHATDYLRRALLANLDLDVGAANLVRRLECADRLEKWLMPFAMMHKYFLEKINNGIVDEARKLSTLVKYSFQNLVSRLDWMDRFTKGLVVGKVHDMEIIGYPEWLRKPDAISDCYQGLEFGNGTFVDNFLILSNWEIETQNSRNPECIRDKKWGIRGFSIAEVAPKYRNYRNDILIPGSVCQQPFMGMGLRAADFGALGMLVGHEIQHAFDNFPFQIGEDSNMYQWSNSVKEIFLNRSRCFLIQHDNYMPSLHKVDDDIFWGTDYSILNEDVADNVGLEVAFQAYKLHLAESATTEPRLPGLEDFTPEQVFFLSFAHAHCSAGSAGTVYQVMNSLSNSEEFSQAWKCSRNSRMNPENKCIMW